MKLSIFALVSILASGACAEVADPCLICPNGATADNDFRPYAGWDQPLNATCDDLIEAIKAIEAGSVACKEGAFENIRSMCCPDTPPENDPCIVCSGEITAGEYFVPCENCTIKDWSSGIACRSWTPLTRDSTFCETCKNLVDSAAVTSTGSKMCTLRKERIEPFCCPTTPQNPCIICPDYRDPADTFAPNDGYVLSVPLVPFANNYNCEMKTCKEYIDEFNLMEKDSESCAWSQHVVGHCCPSTRVNPPCIACPDGITVDNNEWFDYERQCKERIKEYTFLDVRNPECGAFKDWDEAFCCPTIPKNPCNICPNGLTASDHFYPPPFPLGHTCSVDQFFPQSFPIIGLKTCKDIVDTLVLIESESEACSEWSPYYKVLCCPNVSGTNSSTIEEASTVTTTTASTSTATTMTSEATISAALTGSDATYTSSAANSELVTTPTPVVPSTEPILSGGMTVFEFRSCPLIIGVSALSCIAFV